MGGRRRRLRALAAAEWLATVLVTGVVVAAHVVFMRHAGALWRDEANTLSVATMPSLAELWSSLEFESFPAFWPLVLRLATFSGAADGDHALRVLGFVVGLAVVAALWWNARVFGALPFASLVLFASSPAAIRWGDSLRAYGAGILFIVLCLGALWRLLERPTRGRAIFFGLVALLGVQTLYHNSILLFALCVAGVVVALQRGDRLLALVVFVIGFLAALSLLPYIPVAARIRQWSHLVQAPVDLSWLLRRSSWTLATSGRFVPWVWLGLLVMVAAYGWSRALGLRHDSESPGRRAALFIATVLSVALPAYAGFLLVLGYPTAPWYYLAIMGLVAAAADAALGLMVRGEPLRTIRLSCVLLLAMLITVPAVSRVRARQTNVDILASALTGSADARDLIVVHPSWPGVAFSRYYRGPARWATLPDVPDHRTHRYDLIRQRLQHADPDKRVRAAIRTTLASGHRVWLVTFSGWPDGAPRVAPAAHNSRTSELRCLASSSEAAERVIRSMGATVSRVDVPVAVPVNAYENLAVFVAVPPAAPSARIAATAGRDDDGEPVSACAGSSPGLGR